ncbi:MAG: hypothetical protein ACK56F_16480, partial [bacterium]
GQQPRTKQKATNGQRVAHGPEGHANPTNGAPPTQKPEQKKRRPMYIPKLLADMMWATTKDSTCVSFGMGHRCMKHNQTFNLDHITTCSEIQGCKNIAKYAKMIKEKHILDWQEEDRQQAILE